MISRAIEFERNGWLIVDFGNEANASFMPLITRRWATGFPPASAVNSHVPTDASSALRAMALFK